MRGGFRPGAGRPKGVKVAAKAHGPHGERATKRTPLQYMLDVMNDDDIDGARRDRMAIAAAPFMHPRKEPVGQGKREEAVEAAKKAASGKFAPPAPPKLVVDNG